MVVCALLLGACAQVPFEQQEAAPDTKAEGAPARYQPATIEDAPLARSSLAPAAVRPEVKAAPRPVDMWERVRAGFRIPDIDNGRVRMWERWYSERPEYVEFIVELGSRFLYHVVEEVERRDLPTELTLLPMIESAYNPYAYSRSHASGIWQFIRSTAKNYGLRQTFWYDGRRDVIAATSAALDYLQDLHEMFGRWDLALAAYNMGENGLNRSIARNKRRKRPVTYERLWMPRQTRNYFPKLQAIKNIVSDPARFGLTLADIPNRPYFGTVTTDRHIDVKLAAELAEISNEEFRILNPAHNKPVIRAGGGAETILLPLTNLETFRKNLQAHDAPLVSWQTYKYKRKDRLWKIAKKHGVSTAYLKQVNGISPRGHFHAGDILLVPSQHVVDPHLPDLPAPRFIRVRYYPQPKKKPDEPDVQTSAPTEPTTRVAQESDEIVRVLVAIDSAFHEDALLSATNPND